MKSTASFFLLTPYLRAAAMTLATRAESITIPAPFVFSPSNTWDGNDGSWSTFNVNAGTPGQDFRVLISTAGYETWVVLPEGCTSTDPSNCANARGAGTFSSAASHGFDKNQSSTWDMIGLYSLDLEHHLGYSGNGFFGYDRVGLGTYAETGGLSLNRTVVAGIADKDYFLGHLGLSTRPISFESTSDPVPSFFTLLRTQKLIPSSSYGYTAGAPYRQKKVPGSLVLGGFDRSRSESPNTTFTFSNDPTRDLTVGVQSIVAQDTLIGVASLTTTGHLSFIDSTVPHIWLPRAVCDAFERAFGLIYDPTTDLYLVNDTMHAQLQSLNPTITFKLGNQARIDPSGESVTIDFPYAAFDLQASYPLFDASTNYFPIRRAANDTQYTLGRTFLQEAYLVVDNERRNFTVAQAVFPNPMPTPEIVTILCADCAPVPPASNGLSKGAIAGIGVGAALLIILAIAAVGMFLRLRSRKRKQHLAELANVEKPLDDTPGDNKPYEIDGTQMRQELPSPNDVRQAGGYTLSEKHGGLVQESFLSPQLSEPPTPASEMPDGSVVYELPGSTTSQSRLGGTVPRQGSAERRSSRWVEITEEEARNEGISSPSSVSGGVVSPITPGGAMSILGISGRGTSPGTPSTPDTLGGRGWRRSAG